MAKKLSSVLGVDIGSRKIKIAEVRGGREPSISAIGMIDTPEGAVDHSGIYNSEAVGAALKQAIAEAGASVSHVVISIAGQASVLVRTLEVPRMNPNELKEHMQWEINRNIPFAESTVVSDFRALESEDPNSPNMDVVMAIAPQSAIDTVIQCVKKAGKQTAAIDVEPLGIARSLNYSYAEELQGQTVCVVDIGHKTTSINIYRDGKLLLPRQVPIGGEMFTKAIADALSVGTDEAEAIKQQKCDVSAFDTGAPMSNPFASPTDFGGAPGATAEFVAYNPFTDDAPPAAGADTYNPFAEEAAPPATDDQGPAPYNPFAEDQPASPPTPGFDEPPAYTDDPSLPPQPMPEMSAAPVPAGDPEAQRAMEAVAPVVEEFVAEVRRSIDYYRSRGGDVQRVEICGGGAKLRGLSPLLSKSIGLPCDAYDPLRRLNLSAKRAESTFVDEHRQEFAVAIGNGLHIMFD
jgi:type IV pilus assembly protein PilM